MNYVRNYYDYIAYVKTLNRQKLAKIHPNYAYYEKHHICPKCLGGLGKSSPPYWSRTFSCSLLTHEDSPRRSQITFSFLGYA